MTVLFALVLFLIAVAQRLRIRTVRIGAMAVAVGLLVYALYTVSALPRL
jgi:ABC-type transport system involved in cytochrome c biogenesis permease subunit